MFLFVYKVLSQRHSAMYKWGIVNVNKFDGSILQSSSNFKEP